MTHYKPAANVQTDGLRISASERSVQMAAEREARVRNPLLVDLIHRCIGERRALGELNTRSADVLKHRLMGLGAHTEVPPHEMDKSTIKGWLAASSCAPSTRAAMHSAANSLFNWACAEGIMHHNPVLGVKRPKVTKGENRSLSREEVERIRAIAKERGGLRGELIFSLLHGEGLRRLEVASIQVHDVDMELGVLHVRGKGYEGQRSRRVPMSHGTQRLISLYFLEHSNIYSGDLIRSKRNPDKGITSGTVGELVADWMRKAKVKHDRYDGMSAHALRHTFAEEVAAEATDIRVVQQALGHANLATTQTYLRQEVDGLEEIQRQRFAN